MTPHDEAVKEVAPLTDADLLDIYLGRDDRGAFFVSKKCQQLVDEYRSQAAELARIRNAAEAVVSGWLKDDCIWPEEFAALRAELERKQ